MADTFSHNELAVLLNSYFQTYLDNPRDFQAEFEAVEEFKNDLRHGRVPNYGRDIVADLERIRGEG